MSSITNLDSIYPMGFLSNNFREIPSEKGVGYKINEYGQIISTKNMKKILTSKWN